MSSVRDLLLKQKAAIGSKLEPLLADRARLREQLMNTSDAIAVLSEELQQIQTALRAVEESQLKSGHLTIMDAILEVLDGKPDGMTAQEILAEINVKYFDGTIARASLSPQLSRLKDRDKKVELRGNKWCRLSDEPNLFKRRI
jgi:hypothetical protein